MNNREKLGLTGPITKKSYVFWVWATQLAPLLGVALAFFLAFKYGIGWMEIIVFLTMGTLGGIGVEVGFHRYFSHKSFKAVKPLSVVLVVLGSMTVMGPVFYWAHYHRRHHQHSDTEKDPHSPNDVYGDKSSFFKRLWFAHFGWNHSSRTVDETFELRGLFQISKDLAHFTESRVVIQAGRRYYFWVLLGILLPATICGLLHGTWYAFLSGALWGGLVRIAVGQHVVWGINSIAHTFGGRFFGTSDRSVNTQYVHLLFCIIGVFMILMTAAPEVKLWGSITFAFIFAMITVGGGWHNNHHAFPNYAVQQYSWWQIDPYGWLILLWQRLGLVSAATYPSRRKIRNYRAKNDATP